MLILMEGLYLPSILIIKITRKNQSESSIKNGRLAACNLIVIEWILNASKLKPPKGMPAKGFF